MALMRTTLFPKPQLNYNTPAPLVYVLLLSLKQPPQARCATLSPLGQIQLASSWLTVGGRLISYSIPCPIVMVEDSPGLQWLRLLLYVCAHVHACLMILSCPINHLHACTEAQLMNIIIFLPRWTSTPELNTACVLMYMYAWAWVNYSLLVTTYLLGPASLLPDSSHRCVESWPVTRLSWLDFCFSKWKWENGEGSLILRMDSL